MNRLVIATRNSNKVREIREILKDIDADIVSLDDLNIESDVVEDKDTFEGNAYKKAYEIMKITGEAVLADDSGLEVDALNGQPGVHSARFAGVHGDDKGNNDKLLELMKNIPDDKRGARFVSVIVLIYPDLRKIVARGEISGCIGHEIRGSEGFGYDPLFVVPEYNQTFAELGSSIKNSISHRARALSELRRQLLKGF